MPSKKKKYNSRFPPARIKKIMQTDEEVGKVAAAVPVIISRALEMFIQSLILKSSETTTARNAKTLTPSHIKQTIHTEKNFDFLHDLVSNIPDHQPEDDSVNSGEPKRCKSGRPRKCEPGSSRKRKDRKESTESSEANDDEETETDEDQDHYESDNSRLAPSTSVQATILPAACNSHTMIPSSSHQSPFSHLPGLQQQPNPASFGSIPPFPNPLPLMSQAAPYFPVPAMGGMPSLPPVIPGMAWSSQFASPSDTSAKSDTHNHSHTWKSEHGLKQDDDYDT
ncbi:dr1-associated corepressor-like isoform X2 [Gigantopelta aegis]|uniref:dr1-associated corepressor-like isoform X2 n=1 Tax=Gigantopelta aegis TaxID=1735272 RepID=UPI001B8892B1|nr:dr1-associated corepressor-like isoform X2 [Gigantopelta aegis]